MPEFWNLSCPDWEDRIRKGKSLIPDLPLNQNLVKRSVSIFNKLRLPDVVGKPYLKNAAGEWFKESLGALFGSLIDNERMIRELFLLVPKKSSKTSYGAALMVTGLLLNQRPRAELLFIGPTKAVADLAFSQASGMIDADPFLKTRLHPRDHLKRIEDVKTGAALQIKAFDMSILTGVKPVGVLIDELHEISAASAASRIIGQLRGGLLPNPEAFLVFITTQSDIPPAGAFKAELDKARAIRDGKIQGRMLPVIYEFPKELAKMGEGNEDPPWFDKNTWKMVSPNLGRPVTIERLEEDFNSAQQAGQAELRRWASQHLNIEIGLALNFDRWAGADYWEKCGENDLTLEEIVERSEVLTIGIDGGGLDDLLSICILGRESDTKRWLSWTKSWAHSKVLDLHKIEAERMMDFASAGDLVFIDNLGQDIEELADICLDMYNTGKLSKIGLDPMGVGAIIDALADRSIDSLAIGITQGYKMTAAIKTTERKLAEGMFVHGNQAINAWAVGNAKVEPKGNAIIITKQVSGRAKVDPLFAIFDAVTVMSTNPEAQGSIYDSDEDYKRVFGEKEQIVLKPWDPKIIQNVRHPKFQEHKKRFEEWQKNQPDEDELEVSNSWFR